MTPHRLNPWLSRVPAAAAVRLELRYDGLTGLVTLAGWEREEVAQMPYPADAILEVAQDHCNHVRARVSLALVWLDAEGRTIASKPIRCEPEDDPELDTKLAGSGEPPKEEATAVGIVAQLMRHVENRERMLNMALSVNLKTMHDQLRDARGEADQLRNELRLERQKARARKEAESEGTDMESEARAEAMHKVTDAIVTHLVPLAAARLREGLQ